MINDTNKAEVIEHYLLGKLDQELLEEFKQRLATDDQFRGEVALEQALFRNLQVVGRKEQRLKLEAFHQEMTRPAFEVEPDENQESEGRALPGKVIQFPVKRLAWMVAASIALIIGTTLILNPFERGRMSPETMFATSFTPYPGGEITRGDGERGSTKAQAFSAYQAGNYPESIDLFKAVPEDEKDEMTWFFLGNALLSADRPREAIDTFESYLVQYEEFAIEAKWYLGLAYLKVGEETEAKRQLEQVAATPDPQAGEYKGKAKELLNHL
jgi:tetratricopeptide (TPR) repeat protein